MKKIAVDVVLLPPPDAMEEIIKLNRALSPESIQLNTTDFLPHISLAMGVLDRERLDVASEALQGVSRRPAVGIKLNEVHVHTTPNDVVMSGLLAERSPDLVSLHLDVMDAMRPFFSHDDVTTEMFASPPEVAEVSTYWVEHYYDKKSADDFHPHVTLGRGKLGSLAAPITFTSSRLALGHLGTYCTCRKVLVEASLQV